MYLILFENPLSIFKGSLREISRSCLRITSALKDLTKTIGSLMINIVGGLQRSGKPVRGTEKNIFSSTFFQSC
jgi:hypothetical protein